MKNKELLQFSIQPQNSNQVQGKLFNWLSLSSVAQLDRIRIRPFMGWFYIKNELRVVILQACTLYIVHCTYSIYKYKTKEFLQNFFFLFDSKPSIKSWQNGVHSDLVPNPNQNENWDPDPNKIVSDPPVISQS